MVAEIGNKALLRRTANRLVMLDQRVAPPGIDTSSVKMVVPMLTPWDDYISLDWGQDVDGTISGNPDYTRKIAGNSEKDGEVYPIDLANKECRVLAMAWQLSLDGAGATTMAGKFVLWSLRLYNNSNTTPVFSGQFKIDATVTSYRGNLRGFSGVSPYPSNAPSTWAGLILMGQRFDFRIETEDGTNFAANSGISMQVAVTKQGAGIEPPT